MSLILYRYILREIWPTYFVSLLVCAFIVLGTRMLSITELIVAKGVRLSLVGQMFLYLLPDIISFALPGATLIAILLAFGRMGVDNELIALKSAGISLYQLLPPAAFVSLVSLVAALWLGLVAVPWGNRSFKDLVFQMAQSRADVAIKERIFSEPFKNVIFYVNSYCPKTKTMRDVFVVDRRDPETHNTIIAEKASILVHPAQKVITLHFSNGTIFMVGKDLDSATTVEFKAYDLTIDLKDIMAALSSRRRSPKEMSVQELMDKIKAAPENSPQRAEMMVKLLEKVALPIGAFLMGIIGVPLGARIKSRGKSTGIGISLVIFLVYYIFFGGMKNLCEAKVISPQVGVWIPDLFLLICTMFLLWATANEKSIMAGLRPGWLKRTAVL